MGIPKSKGLMLALASMALAMGADNNDWGRHNDFEPKETPEEKKKRLEKAKIDRYERQGMKQFHVDGKWVWARNLKNAIRKANNIKE